MIYARSFTNNTLILISKSIFLLSGITEGLLIIILLMNYKYYTTNYKYNTANQYDFSESESQWKNQVSKTHFQEQR
jgi:hypothetical protein